MRTWNEAVAHARSGYECAGIVRQLGNWAILDGRGVFFDSSAGFDLPNGSNRSPDASWILTSRLEALSAEELNEYPPICPDFVVEVRSKSDRLSTLREKMAEYIDNGARLGWLIDPIEKRDPELPGFTLDLTQIWHPKVWSR